MISLIKLLRPHQWVKNFFVFLPLFFSGQINQWSLLLPTIIVFFAFSFIASSVYCFNDILDIENDRLHPTKSKRPLVSGAISKRTAYLLMGTCLLIGFGLLVIARVPLVVYLILGGYYLMNIAYCLVLKQKALIDVIIISLGFVLRILAGGLATGQEISHWIVLVTFLLALFLAFAKRRDDYTIYEQTGTLTRCNIVNYNADFLNAMLIITSTITLVAYIMYTVSPEVIARMGSEYVYTSALFVFVGILRYLQLALVLHRSGSPTDVLLRDRFTQVCVVCWVVTLGLIMYL